MGSSHMNHETWWCSHSFRGLRRCWWLWWCFNIIFLCILIKLLQNTGWDCYTWRGNKRSLTTFLKTFKAWSWPSSVQAYLKYSPLRAGFRSGEHNVSDFWNNDVAVAFCTHCYYVGRRVLCLIIVLLKVINTSLNSSPQDLHINIRTILLPLMNDFLVEGNHMP